MFSYFLKSSKNIFFIQQILFVTLIAFISNNVDARGNPNKKGYANPDFNIRLPNIPYDVSYSWNNAKIYYPGMGIFSDPKIDEIKLDRKHPVVVFLHGSGGFGNDDRNWGSFLADNGYVVIFPDSYSIPNRFRTSGTRAELKSNSFDRKVRSLKISTILLRITEAKYALREIRKFPWVDIGAVFVMGHSEGGGAAGRFGMPGLAGVITSGYKCVGKKPVRVNKNVPLLALNHETDFWFTKEGNPHCSRLKKFNNRVWSKEVVLPGEGHDTDYSPKTRQAVLDFLEKFR